MKSLITSCLTILLKTVFCQYGTTEQVDNYKPYLIENTRIVGANTAALNKDKGETAIDTIHYWFVVIDTTSGLTVKKKNGSLTYNFLYGIRGYGLWIKIDPNFGPHWDLFDERFRLLRNQGVIITQIIELNN